MVKFSLYILVLIGLLFFNDCSKQQTGSEQNVALKTRWAAEVSSEHPWPEYPRPQMIRPLWKNLNGLWQIELCDNLGQPPTGKTLSRQILVPFPIESALSGVQEKTKHAWYRRVFKLPEDWSEKNILLHFGAVDWQAVVYINGQKVGKHRGGYDHFSFDITPFLKQGTNELLVGVFDPTDDGNYPRGKQVDQPGGIFYTSVTGIWQTVWLEPVNKVHLTRLELVPNVDRKVLHVKAFGQNATSGNKVRVFAYDQGQKVSFAEGVLGQTFDLPAQGAQLWSPENPVLYRLTIELWDQGKKQDEVESYFAMRKVHLGKDENGVTRLFLNNKPLFQVGPLDQGYWPDGLYTAPTDEALKFDIEAAKKLGFNMIRKHAKREPDRWYYWCDKLGMLVWQDMPSVNPKDFEKKRTPQTDAQFETELKEMIKELYNFPSIYMWVVFNEGWGQFDTERFVQFVRQMDPSRLVDNASGWVDKGIGDVVDIQVYPGPGSPQPEEKRAAVLGEFGGLGLPIPGHLWTSKNWGYQKFEDRAAYKKRFEELFDKVWRFKQNPGLSAAVYTQITDVETETNGILTYDRQVCKIDYAEARNFIQDKMVSIPQFQPLSSIFLDQIVVTLKNRKGEAIRYTLDGSEPTEHSTLYTGPIALTQTATVRARSFASDGRMSGVFSEHYQKTTLRQPDITLDQVKPGLKYAYFEGRWEMLPDFSQLQPVAQGITEQFDLSKSQRSDFFGLRFVGYINAPQDGIYTFFTESDDGSKLFIGGKEIVNNDGLHGMNEKSGQVALKKGLHKIEVIFFEGAVDEGLVVRWQGPNVPKQVIPARVLFH
ncbi:MAG: chitobiase/beta-hexosaminidase C-terminal domain-containing protein [Caldisericaceae bacterium]|nr:chitobiase/beta-hexosaminidase C-terminal domain-containing protein [Caldisericaceae bacterium]